ncbi:Glutathione transferase [Mycena indigotica]|uniref:Glutathione transferase n=1 Tax=Mycena indigotica TaxID=2126181 RepID=A0A8H6SXY9_9AGAR|nr:Glutathione transferase [Mycena indigotica]KAF7307343.1 Glutathione transferase [Mycena indigotica]
MSATKSYHLICTGTALKTAQKHAEPQDITLFGSCFCPFVQRVWAAMEYLQVPYEVSKYCENASPVVYYLTRRLDEVDPYKKPADLLEVSPKGLVPGLKLHRYAPARGLNESIVILEYLEDLAAQSGGRGLLPKDPYARALVRLQCDHVNRAIVPAFYRLLQAQEGSAQIEAAQDLRRGLERLVNLLDRAEREILGGGGTTGVGEKMALAVGLGLWNESGDMNLTDVMVAPYLFRASNVLKHYRGFELPEGEKFGVWTTRLFGHAAFKATCSTEELYLDSYESVLLALASGQKAMAFWL